MSEGVSFDTYPQKVVDSNNPCDGIVVVVIVIGLVSVDWCVIRAYREAHAVASASHRARNSEEFVAQGERSVL